MTRPRSKKSSKSSAQQNNSLTRRPNDPIVAEIKAVRNKIDAAAANTAAATETAAKAARAELKETIGRIFRILFAMAIVAAPFLFLGTVTTIGSLQFAGLAFSLSFWLLFICHIVYRLLDGFERKLDEIYLTAWDCLEAEFRQL